MRSSSIGSFSPSVRSAARKMVIFSARNPGLTKKEASFVHFFALITRFLPQLALGGLQNRLAFIDAPGRQLPKRGAGRQSILPHQQNAILIIDRHHDGRSAVLHDGALDFEAIRIDSLILSDGEDRRFQQFFGRD